MNRKNAHIIFGAVVGLGAFCNILFAVALKTTPDSVWPFLTRPVVWLQQHLWWLWPCVTLVMFLARVADKRFCDRWGYDAVKEMLDVLRQAAFPDQNYLAPKRQDPQHYHRVTLFRYRRWRLCFQKWPWSGWLIPVARSGHTTQNRKTCFRVPDSADYAEGVAGQVWIRTSVVLIPERNEQILPNLFNRNAIIASRSELEKYARATFVSVDWVKKKSPASCSFMGIPVVAKGVPWGVIIVDSRASRIANDGAVYSTYNQISRPFIKCIERLQ